MLPQNRNLWEPYALIFKKKYFKKEKNPIKYPKNSLGNGKT